MKRVADDATMRKEPGWRAQARATAVALWRRALWQPSPYNDSSTNPNPNPGHPNSTPDPNPNADLTVGQAAGCKDSSKTITSAKDIGACGSAGG